MAKIINFKLVDFSSRWLVTSSAAYEIEAGRYAEDSKPIGVKSWQEEKNFIFYSEIDKGVYEGKTAEYEPASIGSYPEIREFKITMTYELRTNEWDWDKNPYESNEQKVSWEEESEDNWYIPNPPEDYEVYGETKIIYTEGETIFREEVTDEQEKDENGNLKYDEEGKPVWVVKEYPDYTIYIEQKYNPIIIYGKWEVQDAEPVESIQFYPAPDIFPTDYSNVKIGLNCTPYLTDVLPLEDFEKTASQWKTWILQTETPCHSWGSGPLSASVLNSMYEFCDAEGGFNPGDIVTLGMFTSLFGLIN